MIDVRPCVIGSPGPALPVPEGHNIRPLIHSPASPRADVSRFGAKRSPPVVDFRRRLRVDFAPFLLKASLAR